MIFYDLKVGDVFKAPHGDYMIKTSNNEHDMSNATNLTNGHQCVCGEAMKVEYVPVNVHELIYSWQLIKS